MFQIDEFNNIKLTAGDDATIAVAIVDASGEAYEMVSGDTLTFIARQSPSATIALTSTSTTNTLALTHTQTTGLSGLYIYQIQLTTSDSKIYTIAQGTLTMIGDLIV